MLTCRGVGYRLAQNTTCNCAAILTVRLDYFKAYTAAHPFLERADTKVRSALREPGGALLIFIIGPTGVGKTTLLAFIEQRLLKQAQTQLSHDPVGKTQLSEFPWWHLTDVALPERSTLYALAPIGGGTAGCESLTSYLARLAEAHCIYPGVLLQQMIVPLMRELEMQGSEAGEHPLMVAPDTSEFAWQQWVTHALGAVIARLPGINVEPKRERIRQVVRNAVEQLADGNIVAFARLLGLSTNIVKNWYQGKRIPEMDMLLRLCYRLDLSLGEVLFQEREMPQPSLRNPVPLALFSSRKRTAINKERVFHLLEQAASSTKDPPPSLREVGQRLGYQPTTLYKINQTACHAIAKRFTAYHRELREKRLQGYREEIRRIALYLQAEQVALTQRHIGRYLAQPAILRDPYMRVLLREVCSEVGERI